MSSLSDHDAIDTSDAILIERVAKKFWLLNRMNLHWYAIDAEDVRQQTLLLYWQARQAGRWTHDAGPLWRDLIDWKRVVTHSRRESSQGVRHVPFADHPEEGLCVDEIPSPARVVALDDAIAIRQFLGYVQRRKAGRDYVLVSQLLEGWTMKEIGKILGVTESRISQRLSMLTLGFKRAIAAMVVLVVAGMSGLSSAGDIPNCGSGSALAWDQPDYERVEKWRVSVSSDGQSFEAMEEVVRDPRGTAEQTYQLSAELPPGQVWFRVASVDHDGHASQPSNVVTCQYREPPPPPGTLKIIVQFPGGES